MYFAAKCLVSFLWGCAEDRPEIAKFIGKCPENIIAKVASLENSETLVLLDS